MAGNALTLPQISRLFARLKLRLIAGNLRGDLTRKVGFIFTLIGAVSVALVGFLLMSLLRLAGPELAHDAGIIAFTLIFVGWLVVPLLSFGVDDTLDPTRVALLPLRTAQLAVGLFTSSVIGPWPLATVVVLAGGIAGLATGVGGALLGVAAVPLLFALCVVTSRLITTALSGLLRTRRGRDLTAMGVILFIVAAQIPGLLINSRGTFAPQSLIENVAAVLRWTPSGMAAHAIADGGPAAVAELVLIAALVVLLGWLWIVTLRATMVRADASTQAARVRGGAGIARFLPDGPLAAVVTKELKYARRDPRGRVGWASVVLVTAVLTVSLNDAPSALIRVLFPVGLGALMLGMQEGNAFGIDGRALWMNVVVYGSPRAVATDLAGRHLATSLVAVPLIAVFAIGVGLFAGELALAVSAMLVGWGLLGVMLGVGAVTSVLFPYTVPERLNAFSGAAPGQGGVAFLGALASTLGSSALILPIVVPLLFGLTWIAALAPPYGLAVAWAGRRFAAGLGFARFPELVEAVSKPT